MVNYSSALDHTFSALADPTRRAILARLALGETSVSELARPFEMSLPAVLKHVEVLEGSGLVAARKEGRVRRCRFVPGPLKTAAEWLDHYQKFWEERFDALEKYLKESKEEIPWQSSRPRPPSRSSSRERSQRPGKKSSAPGRTRKR